MTYFDVFNGDADGICALTQLRRANPVESVLITGVKRDIKLLSKVEAQPGDNVTVLDISLDKNRADLVRVLDAGAEVFYCDHHFAGDIPEHEKLRTSINTTSNVCTSLLINNQLGGRYLEWAVVGTFGDNLEQSALGLAKGLNVTDEELAMLKNLGIYINYNGYGASLEDLYFAPAELFQRVARFDLAREFYAEDTDTFNVLESGYQDDMSKAQSLTPIYESEAIAVFELPNAAWARRVSGVFGNDLANGAPHKAHGVLTEKSDGDWLVSVRAPLDNKQGADEICRQFDTGGGRAAAAGINALPDSDKDRFVKTLDEYYR